MSIRKTRSEDEHNRLTVRNIIVEKLNTNKRKPTRLCDTLLFKLKVPNNAKSNKRRTDTERR